MTNVSLCYRQVAALAEYLESRQHPGTTSLDRLEEELDNYVSGAPQSRSSSSLGAAPSARRGPFSHVSMNSDLRSSPVQVQAPKIGMELVEGGEGRRPVMTSRLTALERGEEDAALGSAAEVLYLDSRGSALKDFLVVVVAREHVVVVSSWIEILVVHVPRRSGHDSRVLICEEREQLMLTDIFPPPSPQVYENPVDTAANLSTSLTEHGLVLPAHPSAIRIVKEFLSLVIAGCIRVRDAIPVLDNAVALIARNPDRDEVAISVAAWREVSIAASGLAAVLALRSFTVWNAAMGRPVVHETHVEAMRKVGGMHARVQTGGARDARGGDAEGRGDACAGHGLWKNSGFLILFPHFGK